MKEQAETHSTQESDVEENELVRMLREAAAAAEAEKAAADRLANPTTEDLLKQILEQLKK